MPAAAASTSLASRAVALVLASVVAATAAACGSTPSAATPQVSKAVAECRQKWTQLGRDVAAEVARTNPSALPQRWQTVAATIDYQRTSATAQDCGGRLDAQQKAISAIKAFTPQLTSLDMQAQLTAVADEAAAYAAGPWPAPRKDPKKGTGVRIERPPKPAVVSAAVRTLTAQAPIATREQAAGWTQASVIDLDDPAAKAKAIKDLKVVSGQSPAYVACQQALALIRLALAAKR